MKKWIGLLLAVMMLAALATSAMAEEQGREMYVYTKNGKGLCVRSGMNTTDDNVIATLPYGTKVFTYGNPEPGWTYIEIGNTHGYVMSRFLVKNKPAAYDGSTKKEENSSKDFDTRAATTVDQMNTLLASAKSVEPYTVTVCPSRTSGWVYLRWLPSRHAAQVATFAGNQQVIVIAELKDWYQVEDPATGKVGFVYKSYIQ